MLFTVGVLGLLANGLEIHAGLYSDYGRLKRCNGINILEMTIPKAHSLYIDKKLSPLQLIDCYLKRIEAMNPVLGAVLHVHPFARDMARSMPYPSRQMIRQQPLYGIPVLVKGNIALEPLNNTAGSNALKDNKRADADVVTKLRRAGAIVFGTCNLSEFAGARSIIPPEGWSHLGGETINPYHLNATTTGSSSGSAVAVAANLALVSLGTETVGSVISPASCSMVVGFKPTYNWTSTKGIIPLAPSLDTVGVLTRTVQDSHLVMEILHDSKPKCSALDLPKKVGIISPVNDPALQEKFNVAIAHLKTKIQVQEHLKFPTEVVDLQAVMEFLTNEFKYHINQYLSQGTQPLSLEAIIQHNVKHNNTHNSFPQELLEAADGRDGNLNDESHLANQAQIIKLRAKIMRFMDKNNLDVILIPSVSSQNDLVIPDMAGFPVINIPAGLVNSSIPQGLSLYARQGNECMILSLASTLEHIGALERSPPNFYFTPSSASQGPPCASLLAAILLLLATNLC